MEITEHRFIQTQLWKTFEQKAEAEQKKKECQNVKEKCVEAVNILKTIRDTFPTYTLHDETHSINVLDLMAQILGDQINELTSFESALLILSAFYHDSGMVVKEEEKTKIIEDDRFKEFLNKNPYAFNRVYESGLDKPIVNNDVIEWYYRTIHHERVWNTIPDDLSWEGYPYKKILSLLCESHGWDTENLITKKEFSEIPAWFIGDIRFCAILLRLGDILDFDNTRAPYILYEHARFKDEKNQHDKESNKEWKKQIYSLGFRFPTQREHHYLLPFAGSYNDIQVEYDARSFLDIIDEELNKCCKTLDYCNRWKEIKIPQKIDRTSIQSNGYKSGDFRLKINQEKIIQILAGENLYENPIIFVRELIQNAIDTVRTRKIFENGNLSFVPRIDITTWMDNEGYYWFRIDDNGMGMNEEKIMNFFLSVGSSYYTSDDFIADRIKHLHSKAVQNYMPISRFGIGILSCFLCGDRMEVSTKYDDGQQIRLSIPSMKGYYTMMCAVDHHLGWPMPSCDISDASPYKANQGTAIAVRINIFKYITNESLLDIVNKYVRCPEIPIFYNGKKVGPTEDEYINAVNSLNDIVIELTPDQTAIIENPLNFVFIKPPVVKLNWIKIHEYTKSNLIKGILINGEVDYDKKEIRSFIYNGINIKYAIYFYIRIIDHKIVLGFTLHSQEEENSKLLQKIEANFFGYDFQMTVYNLLDNDIYKQYLKHLFKNEEEEPQPGALQIIHNGIIVDERSYYFIPLEEIPYSQQPFSGEVILKDKMRPEMDISRNRMIRLSYATSLEYYLILLKIKRYRGFDFDFYDGIFDDMNFSNINYLLTEDIMQELMEYSVIKTEEGEVDFNNLYEMISNGKEIKYFYADNIMKAIIQNKFIVEVKSGEHRITAIRREVVLDEYGHFPPLFFVNIVDSPCILRFRENYYPYIINDNHPFSKWLINHSNEISSKYSAILTEIVKALINDKKEDVISKINRFLDIIKGSSKRIFVSDDLYLSDKNFKEITNRRVSGS